MNFAISIFECVGDAKPKRIVRSWDHLCQRFTTPIVRKAKDGMLFSPATFVPARHTHTHRQRNCPCGRGDCKPGEAFFCDSACRNLICVSDLSMLVLDCDHNVLTLDGLMSRMITLGFACAIYSTHSHRRVIECTKCTKGIDHEKHSGNPKGGDRFRIVIPLASPIPSSLFPRLWLWASKIEGLNVDESDKDASRMYYTPAKYDNASLYQSRILPGPWLDWRTVIGEVDEARPLLVDTHAPAKAADTVSAGEYAPGFDQVRRVIDPVTKEPGTIVGEAAGFLKVKFDNGDRHVLLSHDQVQVIESSPKLNGSAPDFRFYEDRHDELCRRIAARGRKNDRGAYDARCLSHGGKGRTALAYFPESGVVHCNGGCTYWQILKAEGLSDRPLPSKRRDERRQRVANVRHAEAVAARDMTPATIAGSIPISAARTHIAYGLLTAHLLILTQRDEMAIREHWETDPFGRELIEHPDGGAAQRIKVCSMPTEFEAAIAANRLAEWIDPAGCPGFYKDRAALPVGPVRNLAIKQWTSREIGEWRMNVSGDPGSLLVPYADPKTGLVIGLYVYRNVRDRRPYLLTSRGMPGGAQAAPAAA